jgi:K+/H+ antiporter YhaU regulatory subunit KhtT
MVFASNNPVNNMKFNPNAPAFGEGAEKLESSVEETIVPEVKEEEVVESDDENKVPYSRFKKFHDEAKEAREMAQRLSEELEQFKSSVQTQKESDNMPDYWVKLYGDSEASKEAFRVQTEENLKFRQQVREEALQSIREERWQEESQMNDNISTIDNNFESLEDSLGRTLKEKEQSELLDIVDEFTPTGEDGKYIGAVMSFDKAWDIYEMRNQSANSSKRQSRDNVASLTGSKSSGEPSPEQIERDKNFDPMRKNAWKDRL